MNFVGHVVAAAEDHDDPDVLLGAALPDLAPVRRLALAAAPAAVAVGVAHHRAVDATFHADDRFVEWCRGLRGDLTGVGVARGPARAAAHVGIELLIDDALLATAGGSAAFAPVWRRLCEPDATVLGVVPPADRARWTAWLRTVTTRLDPWHHGSPRHVAVRVHRLLSHRPRLALDAADVPALAASLDRARREVHDLAGSLVADAARHAAAPRTTPEQAAGLPSSAP